MAQSVQIITTDDLDGSEATETINFALDGHTYEIDLNEDHATALREAVEPYQKAARGTARSATRRKATTPKRNTATPKIRAWAQDNGYEVAPRGRIHRHIIDAYHQATGIPVH